MKSVEWLRASYEEPLGRFTRRVKDVVQRRAGELDELRRQAISYGEVWMGAPDFLWHGIYASFGTYRGDRNLAGYLACYPQLKFECIVRIPKGERESHILAVMDRPGVRPNMHLKKAKYLADNADILEGLLARRGISEGALSNLLLSMPGRDAKLRTVMQFKVIKEKYARNLFMDVYHPDFRTTSFAIDARIGGLLKAYNLPTLGDTEYGTLEDLLLSVAGEVGVSAWDLDRAMYNFSTDFLRS